MTDPQPRVLVVDDEENITYLLDSALRHFGYEVRVAHNGRDAIAAVDGFVPDVVLLDVMMPDIDGFEVVRRLRLDGKKVPVLFLSAKDTTEDKVRGLTLGGDDYVTKPFSLEEVLARIGVILRRQGTTTGSSRLSFADLEMDDDAHVVRRSGQVIELSPTEYNLLRFLLVNAGRVLSRHQILDHVWQYDFGGHATVVETYISYLRKKLDKLGPPLIQTVRGVGYSLRLAGEAVGAMSLRRRVIIGFGAVALVLIVSNVALASTFRGYLLDRIDKQLIANARPLAIGRPFGGPGSQSPEALTEYFVAIADPSTGEMQAVTSVFEEETPPPRLTIAAITEHVGGLRDPVEPYTTSSVAGGGRWRMIAVANPNGYVIVLGASLDAMNSTVARMREIQIFGSLAVLAALGFVSSWVMRLGVHPIAAMADTAEKISGSADLSLRVAPAEEGTEAGRLGASFNSMLDRIQEAFRAREESEAKVRRFAADASHELRTPLTSIRGYAELYRAGGLRDEAELEDAVGRIEAEATRMSSLVDELLQLARLDQEQALEFADVDLGGIATDAVNDARAVEPDRPILLTVAVDESVVVRGNEPALRQVLSNLLGNVRAHTPVDAAASVHVGRDGDDAVIAVADEGPGMAAEVAAKVFERFYRADAARTRAHGGTGLGLSIVDSIARAHGGTVTVSSAPGEGSRFEVRIPVAPRSEL